MGWSLIGAEVLPDISIAIWAKNRARMRESARRADGGTILKEKFGIVGELSTGSSAPLGKEFTQTNGKNCSAAW